MVVVGVADQLQVDMHVPEARQHGHPFCRDDLRAGWYWERADLADGSDTLAVDDNHAVLNRTAGVPIDQRAAHQGFDVSRLITGLQREHGDQQSNDSDHRASIGADTLVGPYER